MTLQSTPFQEKDECKEAYSNPRCPYVTQINLNTSCMNNVEKALSALLGVDGTGLNGGVIHKILSKLDKLEECRKVTSSWINNLKPIIASVLVTALTTYLLTKII